LRQKSTCSIRHRFSPFQQREQNYVNDHCNINKKIRSIRCRFFSFSTKRTKITETIIGNKFIASFLFLMLLYFLKT